MNGSHAIDVFNTVANGVPGTAMRSWRKLGAERIAKIVAFVLSYHDQEEMDGAGGEVPHSHSTH